MWSDEFPIKDLPKNRKRVFGLIATAVGILFGAGVGALFFAISPVLCLIFVVSAGVAMAANQDAVELLRKAGPKNATKGSAG
jgi:hypothetical protein